MARRPVHVYRDTYSLETHRQNHDVNSITDRVAEQLYCIVVNKHTHTHKHQVPQNYPSQATQFQIKAAEQKKVRIFLL